MAKGKYEYWLTEDGLLLLSAWARDGLSEEQIAHNMNVAYSTFRTWKEKYPALSAALKKGKEVVDVEVENALYRKAVGFKETVKKPIKVKHIDYADGKRCKEYEEVVEAEEEIFIPPDTAAQIFWLKNRKPSTWRNKPETDKADDMSEMLKNNDTLAEILRKPVPNRDIEDFE